MSPIVTPVLKGFGSQFVQRPDSLRIYALFLISSKPYTQIDRIL